MVSVWDENGGALACFQREKSFRMSSGRGLLCVIRVKRSCDTYRSILRSGCFGVNIFPEQYSVQVNSAAHAAPETRSLHGLSTGVFAAQTVDAPLFTSAFAHLECALDTVEELCGESAFTGAVRRICADESFKTDFERVFGRMGCLGMFIDGRAGGLDA